MEDVITEKDYVKAEVTYDRLKDLVHEQRFEINKLEDVLKNVKKIVNNDKISGIEAKIMIKELLEKEI